MGILIILCEVLFWVFVIAGLFTRYTLHKKKLGGMLLLCSPIVDTMLLIFTFFNLKNGAEASFVHGLAAYYIGMSIAFGRPLIRWADQKFAYWFANGPKPIKRYGRAHAENEVKAWMRHLLGFCIGCSIIVLMIKFVDDPERTLELGKLMKLWSLLLGIDFLVSFSYLFSPKKEKNSKSI